MLDLEAIVDQQEQTIKNLTNEYKVLKIDKARMKETEKANSQEISTLRKKLDAERAWADKLKADGRTQKKQIQTAEDKIKALEHSLEVLMFNLKTLEDHKETVIASRNKNKQKSADRERDLESKDRKCRHLQELLDDSTSKTLANEAELL